MKDATRGNLLHLGLLVARLTVGGLMFQHGLSKIGRWNEMSEGFPDPFGVGSAASLALVIFAEAGCSVLVALGALTRLALIPLIITMMVAAFLIHGDDPWAKKELAMFFLGIYAALLLTGAGRYSVDAKLKGRLGALR